MRSGSLFAFLAVLPLLGFSTPTTPRIGVKVPLNKRSKLTDENGVVCPAALRNQVARISRQVFMLANMLFDAILFTESSNWVFVRSKITRARLIPVTPGGWLSARLHPSLSRMTRVVLYGRVLSPLAHHQFHSEVVQTSLISSLVLIAILISRLRYR